ncbi:MAG: sensor histidine kinase [Lachnospiraceae bacterium]
MIKKFFSNLFNLHFIILIIIFCTGLLACVFCSKGVINEYKQSCVNQKEQEINSYTSRIVSQFKITDYLKSTNSTIDNELSVVSELFGGRILVVNSSMQIIYDSYGRDVGKTTVMREILMSFSGNVTSVFDWEKGYGRYSYGIQSDTDKKYIGAILITYSIENEIATLDKVMEASVIITTVVVILLLFLGVILSSAITRPFKKMQNSIHVISTGKLDATLEEKGIKEFKNIAVSVNNMLAKVKAINDNQQEFVSNVSHELKTPMASIKVLADSLLMQENADVETYREFLLDINEEIDRENKIISDLLTMVKLDKKTDMLNISLCSMNDILSIVLKRVTPLAVNKNVEIIYESYREITAEVDDGKMIMALTNFCENAVKYNKEMGQVRVSLNSDAKFVYITIADTGIGIPEEALNHVFERFYRVDKARDRATGGTGLGLTIANDIIRMHNGVVKVHSKENEGTTFTIRLPLYYRAV